MATARETATDTLLILEERLSRLSLLVDGHILPDDNEHNGNSNSNANQRVPGAASTRLRTLERTLQALAANSHTVSDVLQLHKRYPDLFHPGNVMRVPATLPPASLAQLVLAHERLYRNTASQLASLNENKEVPDPSSLTKLITLQHRIDAVETRQVEQARQFADLRARSAQLVERWYEEGILDMGDKWADWEERLRDCEILVRRKEAVKKREQDTL